ncbi:hypothetical protein U3516DRAFT_790750 [Neocallimastix sp. 'constans']
MTDAYMWTIYKSKFLIKYQNEKKISIPPIFGYDCPFETPESKEVDHDKNYFDMTLTGSTFDGNNENCEDHYDIDSDNPLPIKKKHIIKYR